MKTPPPPQAQEALALNRQAIALFNQGRINEAAIYFHQAVRLWPDFPEGQSNLGNILYFQGEHEQAVVCYQQALRLKPNDAGIHNNLGNVLCKLGRYEEAVASCQQALQLDPNDAGAHNNLANALKELGRLDEAVAHYQNALRLKPDYVDGHKNLAIALKSQGRLEEAAASFSEAIRLSPHHAEAHLLRAMTWLLMGDFERGFIEYEWLWHCPEYPWRPFPQPVWDGSPLDGKTILLHAQLGLGDTLQLIRYASLVKQQGARVIVECQTILFPLLKNCAGIDQIVAYGAPLPRFDLHAPLASLPRLLRTTLATIPANVPYLHPDPELVKWWGSVIDKETRSEFRVGISWQGNPKHSDDRLRSIPLARFAGLARVEGVKLFSLQKGAGSEQLVKVDFPVIDLGNRFETFADTAAVMKNLDLVITLDSSIAHCAGGIGVPVWVALPIIIDWRWMLDREDSPWYPSMRLFRQKRWCDWEEVFGRIAREAAICVQPKTSDSAPVKQNDV